MSRPKQRKTTYAGDVRLHAVIGGDGPPLLLVPGWRQRWYAWAGLMPALARDFEVVAVPSLSSGVGKSPERRGEVDRGRPSRLSRGIDLIPTHDERRPRGVLGLSGDLEALGPADVTPHAIEDRHGAARVV
jgi:pimeloyl-ACP methyl ester carboxylesterase